MTAKNTNRQSLKTQLIEQVEALPSQKAIFPQSNSVIDNIIQNLEEINPNPQPLNLKNQILLSGSWRLIYASNGTVVTRQFAEIPSWMEIKIKQVYQILNCNSTGIATSNCAKIELPLFGEWKIEASGIWKCEDIKKLL